jgi:hypothetical protein
LVLGGGGVSFLFDVVHCWGGSAADLDGIVVMSVIWWLYSSIAQVALEDSLALVVWILAVVLRR